MTRVEYLNQIETWLATTGMSPAALGAGALGDKMHVYKVRKGRCPSLDTAHKVLTWMSWCLEEMGEK